MTDLLADLRKIREALDEVLGNEEVLKKLPPRKGQRGYFHYESCILKAKEALATLDGLIAQQEEFNKPGSITFIPDTTFDFLDKPETLEAVARGMHNSEYTCDLKERDGFIQEEYLMQAQAAIDAIKQLAKGAV